MCEEVESLPPHWLDELYVEGSSIEETLNKLIGMDELIEAVKNGIEKEAEPVPPKKPGPRPGQKLRMSIQEAIA